jgi:hypothetical protein
VRLFIHENVRGRLKSLVRSYKLQVLEEFFQRTHPHDKIDKSNENFFKMFQTKISENGRHKEMPAITKYLGTLFVFLSFQ